MRRAKRWVYYCEYCGKSGRSASHMARHEKHCTANLHRECRMCGMKDTSIYMPEMMKALEVIKFHVTDDDLGFEGIRAENEAEGISNLEDITDSCPACMLSAIRKLEYHFCLNWSYKKAKAAWWDAENDANESGGDYYD